MAELSDPIGSMRRPCLQPQAPPLGTRLPLPGRLRTGRITLNPLVHFSWGTPVWRYRRQIARDQKEVRGSFDVLVHFERGSGCVLEARDPGRVEGVKDPGGHPRPVVD